MNDLGARVRRYWEQYLPGRFRAIGDAEAFFQRLGEDIESRVQELSAAIAGDDPPGEGYLAKLGRLNMARLNAEEQAMREFLPTEDEEAPEAGQPGQPQDD